ncbi:MAG TPA: hypothetical protein VK572_13970 [Burkholderiales bacterium]|nr:hypothetical protein [Burkholderiales bacterium]
MTTESTNRRESDRAPIGVECALPWLPVPSSKRRSGAKTGVLRKVLIAVAAMILLIGAWQLGRELYLHAKVTVADTSDRTG